jgi:CCR4-NOT transcription complex subunit 1
MSILNPTTETGDDLPPAYLATLVDRLLQTPPRTWSDETQANLNYAIRARYEKLNQQVPSEVMSTLQLAELIGPTNNLVKLVQSTGASATSSLDACKLMLASAETRDISYGQVANALLFMVITQNGQAYDPTVFVAALRDHRAGRRLDWQDVVHAFDREGLTISKQQFLSLYRALLPLAQEYENFDIQLLWGGLWQQLETQLSFVTAFLSCTSEELDATEIPRLRKAFTLDQFEDASDEVKEYAEVAVRHPLDSLDATSALFNMIFQSQDTYKHAINLGIPENVINPHTDYFVVAAAAVPQPWGGLQEQAFKQLFLPFLQKRLPGASFVFHGLWKRDSNWLAAKLIESYNAENINLTFIYDHAVEHGWLAPLTGINNEFGVDLAALAHSHGTLDFDAWLQQAYQSIPTVFPGALANFIEEKARQDLATQKDPSIPLTSVMLSVKTVFAFLTFLQQYLPEETATSILRICIQAYPRLINYGEGYDEIIDANSKDGNSMSAEADAAMQEHFKKLYNRESEVRDLVEALRQYKHSEEPTDQELFACMIAGLFDEYNCFSEYPADALATTAVLFGSIINYNLLSSIALQAGLSMVLEALQGSTSRDDRMYKFGVQALKHFHSRLSEWPSFCERLVALPDLQGTEIWPIANDVVNQRAGAEMNGEATNGITNGSVDDGLAEDASAPFASLSIEQPLRPEMYQDPEEDTTDKISFALNNVSERNINDKFKDLQEAMKAEYHQWFARYLVEDRAKLQPNYHGLFLKLLELFDDRWLWEEVIRETTVLVVRMLNADSTMNNTTERVNLKNLGSWLGRLTLARDKPIKNRTISFVDLLIEAHKTNRLLAVLPFTCKVLSTAKDSESFMPPNPWTLQLLSVLLELYEFPELKINLKFEIEVLCKALEFDMKSIEPSTLVRSSIETPFDDGYISHIPELEGFADLSLATLNRQSALRGGLGDRFSPSAIANSLPDISSRLYYPTISSNNLVTNEQTRHVFLQAAQHAINEIIFPVVERSVTIAAISASQLVTKDFATEPSEAHFRDAAHSMVKALAGSLALVTCREPLRMSMSNNVRSLARDLPGDSLAEGVILMFVNDNIDTVCKVVEEAAEKQSIAIIEDHIREGIHLRQQHQLQHPDENFEFPVAHKYAYLMPEPYKPSTTGEGLRPEQLAIYENFGPSRAISAHGTSASQDSRQQLPDVIQAFEASVTSLPTPAEVPALPRQLAYPRSIGLPGGTGQSNGHAENLSVQDMVARVYLASKDATEEHVKDLGPNAPVRAAYDHLVLYLDSLPPIPQDKEAEFAAAEVMKLIYSQAETRLETEILAQLLSDFSQISEVAAQRIWSWLINFDDEHLLNSRITIPLLQHRLVDLARVDVLLARNMRPGIMDPRAIYFLSELMDTVLLGDYPIALRADFARSIEALSQWVAEDPELELGHELLAKLRAPVAVDATMTPPTNKNDQIEHIFDEWIHFVRADVGGKVSVAFIQQLYESGLLKDHESTALFLRACLEFSIAAYDQEEQSYNGSIENAYLPIDALSQLIVSLVLYQGDPEGPVKPTKSAYLESLLSFIALFQCHHFQQRNEKANQKIFFRLYSGILCEIQGVATTGLADSHEDIMLVFGKLFLALQPAYFPAFAFSWLSLISHRIFMSNMLKTSVQQQVSISEMIKPDRF